MVAKKDFEAELKSINEGRKKIAEMRRKITEMQLSSNKDEKRLNTRTWAVLSDELLRNGIDPTDLKFIVDACIEAKLRQPEGVLNG